MAHHIRTSSAGALIEELGRLTKGQVLRHTVSDLADSDGADRWVSFFAIIPVFANLIPGMNSRFRVLREFSGKMLIPLLVFVVLRRSFG
jgi:hypothetical protein